MRAMDANLLLHQWSELQSDLLFNISTRFEYLIDLLHFRAVCSSWRSSSIPLSSKSTPVKLPVPDFSMDERNKQDYDSLSLTELDFYSIKHLSEIKNSTNKLIAKAKVLESGKFVLKFPVCVPLDQLEELFFKICGDGKISQVFSFLDYRVSERGKTYQFEQNISITKVVVSSSFAKIGDEFTVLLIDIHGSLHIWRLGDKKWTRIRNVEVQKSSFTDAIFYNGRFYAVVYHGLLISIELRNFQKTEVARPIHTYNLEANSPRELVKSLENLFLVGCFIGFINVYKLNEEEHQWELIGRLKNYRSYSLYWPSDDSATLLQLQKKVLDLSSICCFCHKFQHSGEFDFEWYYKFQSLWELHIRLMHPPCLW